MTPDARFRPAVATDLPMILRAERAYMQTVEPLHESRWTAAIDRNLALWIDNLSSTTVVEVDATPAGFVMWAVIEGAATIVTVQVLPPHRRRGHARSLLAVAADQVVQAGHSQLVLGVHRDNAGAAALYESEGFTRGEQDGDYRFYRRGLRERT